MILVVILCVRINKSDIFKTCQNNLLKFFVFRKCSYAAACMHCNKQQTQVDNKMVKVVRLILYKRLLISQKLHFFGFLFDSNGLLGNNSVVIIFPQACTFFFRNPSFTFTQRGF